MRFFSSLGLGGVIYFTPLVFNELGFSASLIGFAFSIAAVIGTITRFCTGLYLNKSQNFSYLLILSSVLTISGSTSLLLAKTNLLLILGQLFLGAAAGIYWPTVELAVPYLCKPIKSSQAFAFVRTVDAFGIAFGTFLGWLIGIIISLRFIYIIDIISMIFILIILIDLRKLTQKNAFHSLIETKAIKSKVLNKHIYYNNLIFALSTFILITSTLSLLQFALPLDLVKGGINRQPISNNISAFIVSSQLLFQLFFQWKIGKWLSSKRPEFGIKITIFTFFIGNIILYFSTFTSLGGILIPILSLICFSIGLASFLPTSTELIIRISPRNKQGLNMALFSQCFAIGNFITPAIAGFIIDFQGNASTLWLLSALSCILITPILFKIDSSKNSI